MKKTRSSQIQERPAAPRPAPPLQPEDLTLAPADGFGGSWFRFWFTPADPVGLHVLRLLGGLLFLYWLLGYAGHLTAFFALDGMFDRQALSAAAHMRDFGAPPVTWSVLYLAGNDPTLLHVIYGLSLLGVALFTLGVATRVTAVLTWVVVVSFQANLAIDYDGDALLSVLAFYLMVGHLLTGWSRADLTALTRFIGPLLSWPLGERGAERPASAGANATLRLVQVHFAIIMVTSALHKLTFPDWWSGVAPWYPMYPGLSTTVAQARQTWLGGEAYLALLSLATYAGLAWQLAFPTFAWWPRGRALLLGGAVAGWLACAFVWGLPLIGPAVMIFCLAYVTPREWHWVGNKLRGLPGAGELMNKVFGPRTEKTVIQRS